MKKNLILTVVMLAIGIGVGRVFSQGEDVKASQQTSHPQAPAPKPAKVEAESTPEPTPKPSVSEPAVTPVSTTRTPLAHAQSGALYDLLHPHERDIQENPHTEDGILDLYDHLQLELKGNNASAIDRHSELRQVLAKYIESRSKAKSEATVPSDRPAQ